MTLQPPAFNDARTYGFEHLRLLAEASLRSAGVLRHSRDLKVTASATGLRVDIGRGVAYVKGTTGIPGNGISQGLYQVVNDVATSQVLTLAAANATNPRVDSIYVRARDSSDLGDSNDDAIFGVVQGTPAALGNQLQRAGAGAIPSNALHLADVIVPAGATSLTAANVIDRRVSAVGFAQRRNATARTIPNGATGHTVLTALVEGDLVDVDVPDGGALIELAYFAQIRQVSGSAVLSAQAVTVGDVGNANPIPVLNADASLQDTTNGPSKVVGAQSTYWQNLVYGSGGWATAAAAPAGDHTNFGGGIYGREPATLYVAGPGKYRVGVIPESFNGAVEIRNRVLTVRVTSDGRA